MEISFVKAHSAPASGSYTRQNAVMQIKRACQVLLPEKRTKTPTTSRHGRR
jgi:hypothetical protein